MSQAPQQTALRQLKTLRNRMMKKFRIDPVTYRALQREFDPIFYMAQYDDVASSGMDALDHFLFHGWREGRKPNKWFEPERYLDQHPDLRARGVNPFVHLLQARSEAGTGSDPEGNGPVLDRALFWAGTTVSGVTGRRRRDGDMSVVRAKDIEAVRPHFDPEFYRAENPDLNGSDADLLHHYMTVGWIKGSDPNPDFSTSYYLRHNPDVTKRGIHPFLHHIRYRKAEDWRKTTTVAKARILNLFEADPTMQGRLAEAKALEPMVGLPAEPRTLSMPNENVGRLTDVIEGVRLHLGGRRFRYVIALPHIRMSGAARVGALFTEALCRVRDPAEILVLTTDTSEREYLEWFPDGITHLDLSAFMADLVNGARIRCFFDLLRGVGAQTLVNINSMVAWEAMTIYGRQFAQEFNVVTYLFTWDENQWGDRVGYPVQWLRATAEYHHVLLTDTRNLMDDLVDRLGYNRIAGRTDVVPLHSPAPEIGLTAAQPGAEAAPRVLWAGRFDRQKRVDILVRIAEANPDVIFDVYGKEVLEQKGLEAFNPPANIVRKGTYKSLSEVVATPYHGFIYTSQWDGLPTILLDIAATGLPIIAPDVGGIRELIDHTTGWLIDDCEDVAAYGVALRDLLNDPDAGAARARAMKARLADAFSVDRYTRDLTKLVQTHDL